jgi:hypothetical protein
VAHAAPKAKELRVSNIENMTSTPYCSNSWAFFSFLGFKTYSLGEGTALANGNPVTLLNTESGGDVSSEVLVALLVTVVLGDVVEVLAADDDGTVHLGGDNTAGQDTATDGDETSEGALLVYRNLLAVDMTLRLVDLRGVFGLFQGMEAQVSWHSRALSQFPASQLSSHHSIVVAQLQLTLL